MPAPRGPVFANPVIPGFSPDPTICRVGDDFYLVCSTFEYFPGLPVYHSRDMVTWELVNHALSRPSQLPLGTCDSSSGNYAPTLRYHDGTFYLICTNYASRGVFYVTATDPRGEWSEPVWLGNSNVDPSFLFDEDGKVYIVHPDGGQRGRIYLMEFDLERGTWAEGQTLPGRFLWMGTGGEYPEGPHIYKIDGKYFLMQAEGGTGPGHRVTVARSDSPWGPYWPYEDNPILTHRHDPGHPIMATGHADLVQLQDGSWWSVFLGIRQQGSQSHLGRETFLSPVEWTADGWPIFNGTRQVPLSLPGPALPRQAAVVPPVRASLAGPSPGLEWVYLRNPDPADYSHRERPGWLRLRGNAHGCDDKASPAMLLRRQRHFAVTFGTRMDFAPGRDGDEAGLVLRLNEALHTELGVRRANGASTLHLRHTDRQEKTVAWSIPAPAGPLELLVEATRELFIFTVRDAAGTLHHAGTMPTRRLAVEASWERGINCFTGLMLGIYATGNGAPAAAPADFAWFDYAPGA